MPGHNGGANFGTSAVDPDRGEFYVVHKSLPTVNRITLPNPPRGAGPGAAAGGRGAGGGGGGGGGGRGNAIVTPEQKAELMAQAKALVDAAKGARVEFNSPVSFMQINFPGGAMTAAAPPWSEMVKYDLNTGDIVWRIPTGVQEAPPEYNIPNNTGVQFPRNAPLVTAGGLVFLAIGPERKIHAYDRDNGKELWQAQPAQRRRRDAGDLSGERAAVRRAAGGTADRHVPHDVPCRARSAAAQRPVPPQRPAPGGQPEEPAAVRSRRRRTAVAERVHRVRLAAIAALSATARLVEPTIWWTRPSMCFERIVARHTWTSSGRTPFFR